MSLVNDPVQFKITHKIEGLEILPPKEAPVPIAEDMLSSLVIKPVFYKDSPRSLLMQKAMAKEQAELGPDGELILLTGSHTGRAADDKYIVHSSQTENKIWWENNIKPMGEEVFETLYEDVYTYLHTRDELFTTFRSVGKSNHFALNIHFISEMPSAALFTQYMFKSKQVFAHDNWHILHAPFFEMDPFKYGTRSDTVIVTSFERKCVIIAGTQYAGEIKKSVFSVMNFLAPEEGILPMHAGANMNSAGETFAFFGLSGTGKTTLSQDAGAILIGDDEHGLSSKGIFNFEGGCYAKTHRLSQDQEPDIYRASTRFGSFLENVKMDPETRELDFYDSSITENGRASYPLEFIPKHAATGEGGIPKDIFFLSADAFGVLPPISRLKIQQAVDFFILGYTAKLAGTEIGVREPRATFSPCFGAPFMLRHPMEYARILAEYLQKYQIQVWLINTGWTGGPAGTGKRFPIPTTRDLVHAVQNHELNDEEFIEEPFFGLYIPKKVRDIHENILNPAMAWSSHEAYRKVATALKDSFDLQLGKFRH